MVRGDFRTRETAECFGSSDISSVIELAKHENRSDRTKEDDRIRKRQIVGVVTLTLEMPVFIGVS